MTLSSPPFGVYIHWPFCAQKCPYCDFNSHVRHKGWDEARFLSAYMRELEFVRAQIGARRVGSIFFGGGTPSLMKPETVGAILDHVAKLWPVDRNAEITIEANPGSVEATRFRGYRASGVNRVSMGLQSLRDAELKKLGRIHTVEESKAALKIARDTFERFSFDLIYARPGQTPAEWRAELAEALDLAGDHISLYQLTIEPDTPYAALHAAGKLIVPDGDAAATLYEITQELTGARGLDAYEISNHAKLGEESRHNLLYWRYGEYAGVGPGAHGRLLADGGRIATVAEKNPEAWAARVEENGHGFTERTGITRAEQADEMLLMGLRLREGVDLARLAALGGVAPSKQAMDGLMALGLLERISAATPGTASGNWRANELEPIAMCLSAGERPEHAVAVQASLDIIRATPKGRFVLNAVVAELSKSFSPVVPPAMDNARGAPY
jgi:putative oxygen-independent coproporphyrinogen III oxidase